MELINTAMTGAEKWESEAQRLKKVIGFAGDDLIKAGLSGRPLTPENVAMLWHAVTRALSDGVKAMSFSNPGIEVFWSAISQYLRREGWTQSKLKELEVSRPWWSGSVLDQIAESDPGVRDIVDEIYRGKS